MFRICLISNRSALLHRYLTTALYIRHFHCTANVFDRSKIASLDPPPLLELISIEHQELAASAGPKESLPSAQKKRTGSKATSANKNGTAPSASRSRNSFSSKTTELSQSPKQREKTASLPDPNSEQSASPEDLNPPRRRRKKNGVFQEIPQASEASGTSGTTETSEPLEASEHSTPLEASEVSEASESQIKSGDPKRGRPRGALNKRVAVDPFALEMPELARVGRTVKKRPVLKGPNADSEQLKHVRRMYYQKIKGDKRRINIVGESLCDDILERMKPSLEKHIGCDIIDINPGAGLWSSKLHDFLKPRTHILMEPDTQMYLPLLQPLLDAEGSTYKLIPKPGTVWAHLNRAISDEYLPHQPKFARGDPRLEEPNDTLLVIANLGYHPKKSYRGFQSLSSLIMHQFLSAIKHHSLFEQYGLVRILIWFGDDEKDSVLPRSANQMSKSSLEAMLSAHIDEIASSGEYAIGSHRVVTRDANLDLESSSRVLKKMETAGIVTPEKRQTRFQKLALLKSSGDLDQALSSYNRSYHNQLRAMEADFAAGKFAEFMPLIGGKKDGRGRGRHTPQMKRLQYLRGRERTDELNKLAYEESATEWEAIQAMQLEVNSIGNTIEAQRRQKTIDRRLEKWKANMDSKLDTMQKGIWAYIEDRRALRLDPPLLLWDRREAEPLRVQDEEFYPSQKMCLLDIHPKSIWPVLRHNDSRDYDFMEFILKYFYMTPSHSVEKGLLSLFPGALEWILPRCPSLIDPAKGGCRDLSLLSVRSLTEEMLKEIIEAFMDWPFRPKRHELITRLGSEVYDPDDLD